MPVAMLQSMPQPLPENAPASAVELAAGTAQAAAPHLAERGGAIVNLIDIYAERPLPGHAVYCMAKAALAMATRALALELAPRVRVNGIAPGAILWPESGKDEAKDLFNGS